MAEFSMSEGRIHIDGLKPADVALLKSVAMEAAELAVKNTLTSMGIDPTKPFEAQADMQFLRSTRKRCEGVAGKALITILVLIVTGAAGMFWVGFRASLKVLVPLIALLALATFALAQERHDRHHAYYQNWVNQRDKGCCNDKDCGELREEDERQTASGVEVRVEGEWCPVEAWHYLKRGNAPNWAMSHVCVLKQYSDTPRSSACERLICYQPKPGI